MFPKVINKYSTDLILTSHCSVSKLAIKHRKRNLKAQLLK